jgi:alkyldihydroxyacetonephosphate synthase
VSAPRGHPVPPVELAVDGPVRFRLDGTRVEIDEAFVRRLGDVCEVVRDERERAETSRDWWPIGIAWALEGMVPALADVVARPRDASQVGAVLAVCSDARVPVTPAAGRSGVCGGSVPVHGGVVLDLTELRGIVDVDDTSLVLDVAAGTFGPWLEETLQSDHGLTVGHWPQSIDLSTVGGWLACRSAGQLSTRYGKIEDMVVGLDVALADGRVVHTGGAPRAAVGPDLTQLFVGSEGTLGVIVGSRLRLHPAPTYFRDAAFGFGSFADGIDACRRVLRRGATPAVLRLYDAVEGQRNYDTGDRHVLLVHDEGDEAIVDATMSVVDDECTAAEPLDSALVRRWFEHRNDVSALERNIRRGLVVDTMEIAARWRDCPVVFERTTAALQAVEGTLAASAHLSHSYVDGACLYFTFAGAPPAEQRDEYYRRAWDAGTIAALDAGAALSHHHGIGLNRSRFVRQALGEAFAVLESVKDALDPRGVLNPGKLGLPDPFGTTGW